MTESPTEELRQAFSSLIERCNIEISAHTESDHTLLDKCKRQCTALLQQEDIWSDGKLLGHVFQEYAQAVFDYTYHDECKLVDEEFPEINSRERIQVLYDSLDQMAELTKRLNPDKQLVDVLGSEITECFYWRKGAVLYMYCSTVQERPEWMNKNRQEYLKNLQNGIDNLKMMLEVRGKSSGEIISNTPQSDDTTNLIDVGVYSDTHLLAMMYTGEMCYWYCTETSQSENMEAKKIGVNMLTKFVQVVKGPLAGQGWSSDRAETLLHHLTT